ncbi:MAG: sterol desaturase family protein [Pseudomonadota bacterium]
MITLIAAGYSWSLGLDPGLAIFVVSAANLVVVAIMEVIIPYRYDWVWWSDKQVVNDVVHGIALSVLGPQIGHILISGLVFSIASGLADHSGGSLWPVGWPIIAQLLLLVLVADFVEWGKHWFYHNNRFCWPIHVLHHNPTRLHITKAGRLHFLESAIRYVLLSAPFVALGAPPELFFWYAILLNTLGNLNHANVDVQIPGFVHYLLMTPQNHRIHHSARLDQSGSNLGSATPLPDLIFGTFRHPSSNTVEDVGITHDPVPKNVLGQLLAPFIWPLLKPKHQNQSGGME